MKWNEHWAWVSKSELERIVPFLFVSKIIKFNTQMKREKEGESDGEGTMDKKDFCEK